LVVTACDAKYGDFLAEHWLASLDAHIDRAKVDVAVLDYGLTPQQKSRLISRGVKVIGCRRDGHIVNIRYRDMLKLLEKSSYEQVLTCDGGDIIFQDNIMPLFARQRGAFRAVCEDMSPPAIEYTLLQRSFSPSVAAKISGTLKNRKMINGGLVIAPAWRFKRLCRSMGEMITDKGLFGPDQVILNYILYKEGFVNLEKRFNFVLTTVKEGFTIKNGTFYLRNGEPITIVHNAGAHPLLRPIKNFGYGPTCNQFRPLAYYALRVLYKAKATSDALLRLCRKLIRRG
jgi:lipopolysaccharide biosynthesis glycosyltransferase